MLTDRPYMRDPSPAQELRPLLWLIGGLVAAFAVQAFAAGLAASPIEPYLALSSGGLRAGRFWTLFTYSLLHDRKDLWHLISNALAILLIGRLLLPAVGLKRFWIAYVSGTLAAAVFWLAVHFTRDSSQLIGASGAVYALIALFCCQFANQRMTFLLFFIVPVTVIPRYLLMVLAAIEGIFFLFAELFPSGAGSPFAHSAHLAGLAAGVIAFRYFRAEDEAEAERSSATSTELPRWLAPKRLPVPRPVVPKTPVAPTRDDLKAEVDRILDKINTSGFGSLTTDEKRTLDQARSLMTKH